MIFNVMTLFPQMIHSYINESIIKNAIEKDIIKVNIYNIRDYSENKHKKVDDYPYGGGGGMIMTPQPIYDCYMNIKEKYPDTKLIYFSPKGKTLNNDMAYRLSKYDSLTLLCGHYEGIDQRIIDMIVDEEISIGDYVLTGGELPALVLIDSVSRKIGGVLSSQDNVEDESFENNLLEYPQYTRPPIFKDLEVPKVLLSGNHKNIEDWRLEQSIKITKLRRPDLLENKDI